jgi:hypothetical protein
MTGSAGCARAALGQAATAPMSMMNSRRFIRSLSTVDGPHY